LSPNEFRRSAMSFPEAVESAHMDHPDFRVGGKVFATLGYPKRGWGMVKLMPDQQEEFVRAAPKVFVPAKGKWGERGATCVHLKNAKAATLKRAMREAWTNAAPKRLAEKLQEA
jgi:hypothetical protein